MPPRVAAHLAPYIVTLKSGDISSQAGRAGIYSRNVALSSAFRRHLDAWAKKHRATNKIQDISEPGGLPIVTLMCSDEVARAIETFDEVDMVVADDNGLSIIRG